jgi:HlyD family secretion protein
MKRRTLILLAVALVAGVALLAWAFAPRPVEVELATAERGRFEQTIDEDARTRLRDRYAVSAPLAGRLSRITLREGDAVEAGAVVATLSPSLSPLIDERTLAGLRARVEAAEAVVLRAAARIDRARVGLEQARGDAARSQLLAEKGFVSPTRLESDRLAAIAAAKELEAAEQDRKVATHDVEQARAALGTARQGGAGRPFEVRAPAAGRVLKVVQASEATVALGAPLLELGDTRRLEVVAQLLTVDALRTTPGDRVSIERWGGPGTLEGRVRLVEPAAFTKVSALGVEEQRVNVLIDIASPPEAWRALGDGYRVSVRIVVLEVPDAVRVPVSAVFPLPRPADAPGEPRWAAFVPREGRARRVELDVGARNGVHAWIRSGLAPGDPVIVYPPSTVDDGVRVVARRR